MFVEIFQQSQKIIQNKLEITEKAKTDIIPQIVITSENKYTYDEINLTATSLKQTFKNYKNNYGEKVNFLIVTLCFKIAN